MVRLLHVILNFSTHFSILLGVNNHSGGNAIGYLILVTLDKSSLRKLASAMAGTILPGLFSGAAFGAALTAAGVYQPSAIMSQLRLEDSNVLQTFLTATAGSAVITSLLQGLGYVKLSPRSFSSFNILGPADANVVGGALLGAGMALSGACPGTVAAQVGLGIRSAYWTFAGGMAGGIVWTGFVRPWMAQRNSRSRAATEVKPCLTIHEYVGVSSWAGLAMFELLAAASIGTLSRSWGPNSSSSSSLQIQPLAGGLLIAGAQLVTLVLRKSMLGTSTVFDELGSIFWSTVSDEPRPKSTRTMVFVTGMTVGAAVLARLVPRSLHNGAASIEVSGIQAALGGFIMVLGSRVAGGCTAGHGISGMSLLSVSSIITVVSMCICGVLVAKGLSL